MVVLERNPVVAEKVRISGGGRCNFTNRDAGPSAFLSENPDFCRSALARYTASDFIHLVEKHGIPYHEKKLGQLFCDDSSRRIIDLLLAECREGNVQVKTGVEVTAVRRTTDFEVETSAGTFHAPALVVATGGLSIPKLGATDLGYRIAEQFGVRIVPPRPGLVPFRLETDGGRKFSELAGVSLDARVECGGGSFRENILFTHRGLSGPAILQASSYWREGEPITIDLIPDVKSLIPDTRYLIPSPPSPTPNPLLSSSLSTLFPSRFVSWWLPQELQRTPIRSLSPRQVSELEQSLRSWTLRPSETEGFAKAEVTVGGVDTRDVSSKTMEARNVRGLFFIGEVLDVTGWLGGYNFQWAWSSAWAAGEAV